MENDLGPTTRYVRTREILESEVDGDVIALDIQRGECYGMNSVASSTWRMLSEERSLEEICTTLMTEFDVSREVCEREVGRLLGELEAAGLVLSRN